jgi:hypothetical protein
MRKTIKICIILNMLLILTILIILSLPQINKLAPKELVLTKPIIIDKVPPVLTLKEDTITIIENTNYIEPGYQAIDNIDGDITNKVTTTTNLNISIPGTYEITYEVTDSKNNKTSTTRKIIVEKKKISRLKTYTTTKVNNETINNGISTLNKYLKDYRVSVGYINLDNGFTYVYNPNKEYFGASLIKVIDAMYAYENNILDTKTKEHVKQAISVSSNTSHFYLVNKFTKTNLNKYINKISFRTPQCNSRYYCQTTIHDQLSYWIYLNYLIEEHPNGEELKSYFINNLGNHLSFTYDFDNLHKYGASDTYYHDSGLFITENNKYIVVILSNNLDTTSKPISSIFRAISKRVSQFNDLVESNY